MDVTLLYILVLVVLTTKKDTAEKRQIYICNSSNYKKLIEIYRQVQL